MLRFNFSLSFFLWTREKVSFDFLEKKVERERYIGWVRLSSLDRRWSIVILPTVIETCESIVKSLRLLLLPSTIARRRHLCYPFANPSSSHFFLFDFFQPQVKTDRAVIYRSYQIIILHWKKKKKKKKISQAILRINFEFSNFETTILRGFLIRIFLEYLYIYLYLFV